VASVCLCVYQFAQNLENYWSELDRNIPMGNAGSGWKLVTFEIGSYVCFFLNLGYTFQMALASSFIFSLEIHL